MSGAGRGPWPSGVGVAPEAPAWFGWADRDRFLDRGWRLGRGRNRPPTSTARGVPSTQSVRFGSCGNLDEFEAANGCSIRIVGDGTPRVRVGHLGEWRGGLPACPDLIAPEGQSLAVQTAVTELGSDRTAEVLAGRAGGAGPPADPAARGLGLGCPTVRTAPHRHVRMVAATALAVERPAPAVPSS
jgi:hypothetical protein